MTRNNSLEKLKCFTWCLLAALLLSGISTAAAKDAGAIRITLFKNTTVDGDVITLGQIAAVQGVGMDIPENLTEIEIGRAPLPGESTTIQPEQVLFRLRQNRIDPDRCVVEANGPVNVVRSHSIATGAQIRQAVMQFVKTNAPWQPDQMVVRPIRYDQDHVLPGGEVKFNVTAPKHTDWLGPVPFRVAMFVDGTPVAGASVSTYIEVWQDVVLAAKPLGRNQPITDSDIKIERMNMARVPSSAVLRVDQVLGYRARRAIAVNSVMRSDQIVMPPAVRKGDVVQVLAESKALKITTQAVAQQNGAIGESIRMMNVRSKRRFFATIVDSQTVRVDF